MHCFRKQESIIIDEAWQDADLASDEYIKKNKILSILCLPILNQGNLIGLLYLENNLAARAFTNQRVRLLEIIATQGAISVRNAEYIQEVKEKERNIRELNEGLERKVEEKTRDIRSILENIKLGIFTIVTGDLRLHKDYSAHLETLFSEGNFADKSALDLLFRNSNLTPDTCNTIEAALRAAIGEDEIAFEVNAGRLVREICYSDGGESPKVYEIDWIPIVNDWSVTDRILVTCKDVTDIRRYKAEVESKKKVLDRIGELINISQEQYHRFSRSSHQFIAANRELAEKTETADQEVLKILFINLHTIKGTARSLGLKDMAEAAHAAESTLSVMRENPVTWRQDPLLRDLACIENELDKYGRINEQTLNRLEKTEKTVQWQLSDLQKEIGAIEALEQRMENGEILDYLNHLKHLFSGHPYRSAEEVFKELAEPSGRLAKDLNKEPPKIVIDHQGISLSREGVSLLQNVFTHILRNTLDHGIELPSERIQAGKSPEGSIRISLSISASGWLEIKIEDDGRGLGLARIREVGLRKGLIQEHIDYEPNDLANLIFASGFSTSATVGAISGRGVGMDAVMSFIEREGAKVHLELAPGHGLDSPWVPFKIVIELPPHFYRYERNSALRIAG
ncbi:MAG: ATP-binding protein [Pseudobdellovibrionaceae bacterium]|nr:ATP-binding protein [Pseudobdellovibrionaceae bacterium]